MRAWALAVALACASALSSSALAAPKPRAPAGMVEVGPGVYRPLYPASPAERAVPVRAFFLDAKPVTNAAFFAFVREHPEWRRDRVKRVLADSGYLAHWAAADRLGPALSPASPVTRVSWYSAKAYCESVGSRLPAEREWEVAALASETAPDGSADPRWLARILAFYSEPALGPLAGVGRGKPNVWGAYDLHGLVWEWIYDFGASLVAADSREKDGGDALRFCGTAGASAQNPSDYAAFMRVAFRSSLEASYTTARLGFRCARDAEEAP